MRYKRKSYILEGSIKGYGLLSIYLTLFLYIETENQGLFYGAAGSLKKWSNYSTHPLSNSPVKE